MTNSERREQILKMLKEQGQISVADIASRFGVSKMTGHRDLDFLENRNLLRRVFGGALPMERRQDPLVPSGPGESGAPQRCTICMRPPQPHLLYRLTLTNGETRIACCPHCGVSAHLALRNQVVEAEAADNLNGNRHSAREMVFLLGSSSIPCCRPSILTFEDEDVAKRFQAGFGGTIGKLSDAINFLIESMSSDTETGCPHCAAK